MSSGSDNEVVINCANDMIQGNEMKLADMMSASRTAIVAHNWKITSSAKRLGRVLLEYWEPITQKEYLNLKQANHQGLNYSPNYKSYFKKAQIDGTSYFMYNSDVHLIDKIDKKVYRCPFNTRYTPGNGGIKNIQSRDDINTALQQSGIKEIQKQSNKK